MLSVVALGKDGCCSVFGCVVTPVRVVFDLNCKEGYNGQLKNVKMIQGVQHEVSTL